MNLLKQKNYLIIKYIEKYVKICMKKLHEVLRKNKFYDIRYIG